MSYATLMVNLDFGHSNAALLQAAGDLAERFQASVIGVAARQPLQPVYGEGFVSGEVAEQDRAQLEQEARDAEAQFRKALHKRAQSLEWRSTEVFAPLADHLAREARGADLVLTGASSGALFDVPRGLNTGDLVMRAGRPVLIVPASATGLRLDRVVIGWKETRETRRATADALPLLRKASYVAVVEIAAEAELAGARTHLADVLGWLRRHGVTAESIAARSNGNDASRLLAIAQEQRAEILVAGAYGHSRLREWVLGGVTRDLLLRGDLCTLVSH